MKYVSSAHRADSKRVEEVIAEYLEEGQVEVTLEKFEEILTAFCVEDPANYSPLSPIMLGCAFEYLDDYQFAAAAAGRYFIQPEIAKRHGIQLS